MSSIYDQLGDACKQFGKRVGMAIKEANDLMATNGRREREMSKYVIELDEDVKILQSISVTQHGNAYTNTKWVANLEELNSDYINEHYGELQDDAYKRGFDDGYKECLSKNDFDHKRGYEDGKSSTHKGCEGCRYESKWQTENPCKDCSNCYKSQYEPMPKDEICFGDEIVDEYGEKGIVVSRNNADKWIYVLFKGYAVPQKIYKSNYRKTGVRRDLDSYFEET